MKQKLFALLFAVLMLVPNISVAFASPLNSTASQNGIYVATEPVPVAAVTYAQGSIAGILRENYDLSLVSLGAPFTVKGHDCDLYYFIVFLSGNPVGTYRVFEHSSGVYTGIYAEDPEFLNAIAALEQQSTVDAPAKIIVGTYTDIYAVVGSRISTIVADYADRVTPTSIVSAAAQRSGSSKTGTEQKVVNIKEDIGFVLPSSANRSYDLRYLPLNIIETQGNNGWCAAYVTAAICRYKTGNNSIYAETIMRWACPEMNLEELELYGALTTSKAIAYGVSKGLNPQNRTSAYTLAQVITEIDNNRPIFFRARHLSTGDGHALMCRGYNKNIVDGVSDPYYSIWNPWKTYAETMFAYNNIYTTGDGQQFQLYGGIHNWG